MYIQILLQSKYKYNFLSLFYIDLKRVNTRHKPLFHDDFKQCNAAFIVHSLA